MQQRSRQCWQIADSKGTVGEQEKVTVVPTRTIPAASCSAPGFLELNMVSDFDFIHVHSLEFI